MTGGPGLDWEDTSSYGEWRTATEGRWKRAFAGMIKLEDGGVSPGLVRRPESNRTRTLCQAVRVSRAFKLSSKPVTVAANSRIAGARRRARLEPTQPEAPGPDGVSDRDWHGLVSRRLTRSQGCQWALPVSRSWVTVAGACRRRLTCGQCH